MEILITVTFWEGCFVNWYLIILLDSELLIGVYATIIVHNFCSVCACAHLYMGILTSVSTRWITHSDVQCSIRVAFYLVKNIRVYLIFKDLFIY